MAFELKNVVPWGRNLEEYSRIFKLTDSDCKGRIISFGDGPASFNFEMTKLNRNVISLDPIYQFTKDELTHSNMAYIKSSSSFKLAKCNSY